MRTLHFIIPVLIPILILSGCGDKGEKKASAKRYTTLRLVHDPETAPIVRKAITKFSAKQAQLPDGSYIQFQLINKAGVPAQPVISSGKLKTELWLSPSSAITNYTNASLTNLGPKQTGCVSLFSTPVVAVAQENKLLQFFASKQEPVISLRKLFLNSDSLAANTNLPFSQKVAFTHATPKQSSSGHSAYLQLATLAAQLLDIDAMTLESWDEKLQAKLKTLELMSSGYASSDRELLLRLANKKTPRPELVLTTEQQLVLFNKTRTDPSSQLIALYPEERTVLQNYNLCRSKADWLTPAHQAAAKKFIEFMSSETIQLLAQKQGFRPELVTFEDSSPISAQYGANPSLPTNTIVNIPSTLTAGAQQNWVAIRKPAAVVFAIDTSGSMDGAPLASATQEIRKLIALVSSNDRMAIIRFSSKSEITAPFSNSARSLIQSLNSLNARGGSAIYDSLRSAYELADSDKALSHHSKIIVLVTDGGDKNSLATRQSLNLWLQSSPLVASSQLYLIALQTSGTPDPGGNQPSPQVDFSDLREIGKNANAFYYEVPLSKIAQPFHEIAQNF